MSKIKKNLITVDINGSTFVFQDVKDAVTFWKFLGTKQVKQLSKDWGYEDKSGETEDFWFFKPLTVCMKEFSLEVFSNQAEATTAKENWSRIIKLKLKDKE